jgi:hypothetical protein
VPFNHLRRPKKGLHAGIISEKNRIRRYSLTPDFNYQKGLNMKRSYFWIALLLAAIVLCITPDYAFAAPGGKIVSGLFKTPLGRVFLVILTILFAPLIAYIMIKERIAEKKTLGLLQKLAAIDPAFEWFSLKERITDCYHRVHSAWRKEDMSEASEWMTSWYWQNQQLAFLNQWERDGLVNQCRIKSLGKIRPLFLKYQHNEDGTSDGSRLVVSITANMEDYLEHRTTGKIVEGKKGYADTEHVWTFVMQNHKWVVSNIEEGSLSLTYARMAAEVPETLPAVTAVPRA